MDDQEELYWSQYGKDDTLVYEHRATPLFEDTKLQPNPSSLLQYRGGTTTTAASRLDDDSETYSGDTGPSSRHLTPYCDSSTSHQSYWNLYDLRFALRRPINPHRQSTGAKCGDHQGQPDDQPRRLQRVCVPISDLSALAISSNEDDSSGGGSSCNNNDDNSYCSFVPTTSNNKSSHESRSDSTSASADDPYAGYSQGVNPAALFARLNFIKQSIEHDEMLLHSV